MGGEGEEGCQQNWSSHQSVARLFFCFFARWICPHIFADSKILAGNSPGGPPNDVEKPEFLFEEQDFKGMLSEALVGAMNKILIAFDCRQIKKTFGEATYAMRHTSPMMNRSHHHHITYQLIVLESQVECQIGSKGLSTE